MVPPPARGQVTMDALGFATVVGLMFMGLVCIGKAAERLDR